MSPDEDALLCLCVFSLKLRADLEDIQNARTDRARLTTGFALAPYSTPDPFQIGIDSERACPEANVGGCLCVPPRAVVRLWHLLPLSPLCD